VLTFNQFLEEGVNDPAIFKAIFLAGGPGSGKSFIVGKTGLQALGYKVVNSDDAFENAMKKAGMEMNPDNIFSPKGQELRGKAKRLTGTKEAIYLKGRLGLVVDGTGKDPDKIAEQAKKVKALGYDVAMIFVNTDLDTAIKRDAMRARTLGAPGVTEYWKAVQRNIGKFQRMFGKPNFLVVDNSEGKNYQKETLTAYRDATKFTNKPVGKKAKKWIEQQKKRKTR
jgi:shikimate kinase